MRHVALLLVGVPLAILSLAVIGKSDPRLFGNLYALAALALICGWLAAVLLAKTFPGFASRFRVRDIDFQLLGGGMALLVSAIALPGRLQGLAPELQTLKPLHLIGFYWDNVFNVLMLSIPQELGFEFSTIKAESRPAVVVVGGLRILTAIFAGYSLKALFRASSHGGELFGTVDDCRDHLRGLSGRGNIRINRIGVVVAEPSPQEVRVRDVAEAFEEMNKMPDYRRSDTEWPLPILGGWNFHDPLVYQWEVHGPRRSRARVTMGILLSLFLGVVLLLPSFFLVAFLFRYTAGLVTLALAKAYLFLMELFGMNTGPMEVFWTLGRATELCLKLFLSVAVPLVLVGLLLKRATASARSVSGQIPLDKVAIGTLLALVVAFSQPGSTLSAGYDSPPDTGLFEWFLFLLDQLAEVLFLGIPGVADLKLSEISPSTTWAYAWTAFIRFVLAESLVGLVVKAIGYAYKPSHFFHGTVKEFCMESSMIGELAGGGMMGGKSDAIVRRIGPMIETPVETHSESEFVDLGPSASS